jgi:hypothetical protein
MDADAAPPMKVKQSHFIPRSRDGWIAVLGFLGLLALAEPPFVFLFANRVEPWILGMPFLYAWLLGVYVAMIGVLLWARLRQL